MHPIKLLAKLTTKTTTIGGVGGSIGGISRADVAAALAFAQVSPAAERMVRWLYCGEYRLYGELCAALQADLRGKVAVDDAMLERLVRLALHELNSAKPCRSCNGVESWPECHVCGGAGIRAMSQRERAALLELPDTTFRRHYQAPADAVYCHAASLVEQALSGLRRQFPGWAGDQAA